MSRKPPHTRRPLFRVRNILLLTILLLVGLIGLEVYRALTAKPGAAIDYGAHVGQLVERYQEPGAGPSTPNAWDTLLEAITRADAVDAVYRGVVLPEEGEQAALIDFSLIVDPWEDSDSYKPHTAAITRAKARRALQAYEEAGVFDVLAEMAQRRRAARPRPHGRLLEVLLPELGRSRHLARASAGRMYMAAERGDFGTVARTYERALALGRVLSHQFTLIDHLVAVAIQSLAMAEARRLLIEHPFDAPTLRAMLDAMDRQQLAPITLPLEGERIGMLDIIQWTHTDDGRGSGRLILSEAMVFGSLASGPGTGSLPSFLGGSRLLNLGGVLFASKAATTKKANELLDMMALRARLPRPQRDAAAPPIDPIIEGLSKRFILLRMVLPAIERALASRDRIEMEREGTRLMLAIEWFIALHGRPPASLDELVPGALDRVPLDPLNLAAFGYRVFEPGEDERGRAYLLYSMGLDGLDNGGRTDAKNPDLAMQLGNTGYDFVLNQPRKRPEPAEPEPPPLEPEAVPEADTENPDE